MLKGQSRRFTRIKRMKRGREVHVQGLITRTHEVSESRGKGASNRMHVLKKNNTSNML
jgi:hypothetical protein